jgi:sporulation protein YlmC with PRC-barrel domain
MEKTTDKPLTRDALVSMQVIDAKGRLIGKVKDLAFSVGKNGIALTVENDNGEIQTVAWEDVQAAADFIILKAQMVQNTYQPTQAARQPVQ